MEVSGEQVTGDRCSRRRRRGGGGGRRIDGGPATTPLLDWTLICNRDSAGGSRGTAHGVAAAVSARKLAARLWEVARTTVCGVGVSWQCGVYDEVGLEKFTRWDINSYSKASANSNQFQSYIKHLSNRETTNISVASSKSQKWSRTRSKHVMQKPDEEETSSLMKAQHQLICTIIKNLRNDVRRERKTCKKMNIANSKLQSDIVEAESLARRIMRKYKKEKRARELLQDICNEQSKRIEAYRAEIEELKDQCARIQDEVEEEKEMLQVADSWREERAQMKLVDAKFILENKYRKMNDIIEDLKTFLKSSSFFAYPNGICNIRGVDELLHRISKLDKEITIVKDSQTCDDEDEEY